jgi:hypothetical protein
MGVKQGVAIPGQRKTIGNRVWYLACVSVIVAVANVAVSTITAVSVSVCVVVLDVRSAEPRG